MSFSNFLFPEFLNKLYLLVAIIKFLGFAIPVGTIALEDCFLCAVSRILLYHLFLFN